jgi:hypothetical protein
METSVLTLESSRTNEPSESWEAFSSGKDENIEKLFRDWLGPVDLNCVHEVLDSVTSVTKPEALLMDALLIINESLSGGLPGALGPIRARTVHFLGDDQRLAHDVVRMCAGINPPTRSTNICALAVMLIHLACGPSEMQFQRTMCMGYPHARAEAASLIDRYTNPDHKPFIRLGYSHVKATQDFVLTTTLADAMEREDLGPVMTGTNSETFAALAWHLPCDEPAFLLGSPDSLRIVKDLYRLETRAVWLLNLAATSHKRRKARLSDKPKFAPYYASDVWSCLRKSLRDIGVFPEVRSKDTAVDEAWFPQAKYTVRVPPTSWTKKALAGTLSTCGVIGITVLYALVVVVGLACCLVALANDCSDPTPRPWKLPFGIGKYQGVLTVPARWQWGAHTPGGAACTYQYAPCIAVKVAATGFLMWVLYTGFLLLSAYIAKHYYSFQMFHTELEVAIPPTLADTLLSKADSSGKVTIHLSELRSEAALPGSKFHVSKIGLPTYVCEVGVVDATSQASHFEPLGLCFRIGDQLFSAYHVVEACGGNPYVRNRTGVTTALPAPTLASRRLDAVAWDLPNSWFSAVGLTAKKWALPKPGPVVLQGRMRDQIVRSYGCLVNTKDALELRYKSSTLDGFSGGPVVQGNNVIGIHLARGQATHNNLGVALSYFYAGKETSSSEDSVSVENEDDEDRYLSRANKGDVKRAGLWGDMGYQSEDSTLRFTTRDIHVSTYPDDDDDFYHDYSSSESVLGDLNGFRWLLQPEEVEGSKVTKIGSSFNYAMATAKPPPSAHLAEVFPEIAGFGWPDRGCQAQLKSIVFQHNRRVEPSHPITDEEAKQMIEQMHEDYSACEYEEFYNPKWSREIFSKEYDRLVHEEDFIGSVVKLSATPGFPLMQWCSTNRQTLLEHGSFIKTQVLDRLALFYRKRNVDFATLTPKEMLEGELTDLYRVFVKGEAHSVEKLEQGRVRLIFGASLVDQLCQRLIFERFDKAERAAFAKTADIPSCPGISFDDFFVEKFQEVLTSHGLEGHVFNSDDVSGWDWSVVWRAVECEFHRRMREMNINPSSNVGKTIMLMGWVMFHAPVALSNGDIYDIPGGLWKSGFRITGSGNSGMRVGASYVIALRKAFKPFARAMGDDCVSRIPVGLDEDVLKEAYRELGYRIKEVRIQDPEGLDFCSHIFTKGKAYPTRVGKVMFHFLCRGGFTMEKYEQLKYEMRHHPKIADLVQRLEAWGLEEKFQPQARHPKPRYTDVVASNSSERGAGIFFQMKGTVKTTMAKRLDEQAREIRELRKLVKSNPMNTLGEAPKRAKNANHVLSSLNQELTRQEKDEEKSAKTAMTPALCMSAECHAWCKLVDRPFTANLSVNGSYIKVPFHQSLVPHRSFSVPNYGITELTPSGASFTYLRGSIFVGRNGWNVANVDYDYTAANQQVGLDPLYHPVGQTLADNTAGAYPIAGYFEELTTEPLYPYTGAPTNTASYFQLPYYDRRNPTQLTDSAASIELSRPVAFAIKVSWDSKLQDSEGWVEGYCFHTVCRAAGTTQDTFAARRVSKDYLGRVLFNKKRSHIFTWKPDGDFYKWAHNTGTGVTAERSPQMSVLIHLPGANAESVMVEYLGLVEYRFIVEPNLNKQSVTAPEAIHIANAVAQMGNSSHKSMVDHVMHKVVSSNPLVGRAEKLIGEGLEAVGSITAIKKVLPYAKGLYQQYGRKIMSGGEDALEYIAMGG